MLRFLIVEDDPPTSDLYIECIKSAWPQCEIELCRSREAAEVALDKERFDLMVLDIELEHGDKLAGFAIINKVNRAAAECPVLVVSGEAVHRPYMLELDAWDYLIKPIDETHFVSVIRNLLRRAKVSASHLQSVHVGPPDEDSRPSRETKERRLEPQSDLSIDLTQQTAAKWRGSKLNLPLTSLRVLNHLYEHRNKIIAKADLYEYLPSGRNDTNLRGHVQVIRDAFREIDDGFDKIVTIPIKGYMWRD